MYHYCVMHNKAAVVVLHRLNFPPAVETPRCPPRLGLTHYPLSGQTPNTINILFYCSSCSLPSYGEREYTTAASATAKRWSYL